MEYYRFKDLWKILGRCSDNSQEGIVTHLEDELKSFNRGLDLSAGIWGWGFYQTKVKSIKSYAKGTMCLKE